MTHFPVMIKNLLLTSSQHAFLNCTGYVLVLFSLLEFAHYEEVVVGLPPLLVAKLKPMPSDLI